MQSNFANGKTALCNHQQYSLAFLASTAKVYQFEIQINLANFHQPLVTIFGPFYKC